jgi:hypothetical protein
VARLRRSQRAAKQTSPRPSAARLFLYLDSTATTQLLAGLEHGLYDVERTARSEESGREAGANIGLGVPGADVGVRAGRTTSVGTRVERDLEQTPESQFARLVDIVKSQASLRRLEAVDHETWAELEEGDVLEIAGAFSFTNINHLAFAVATIQAFKRKRRGETLASGEERPQQRGLLVRLGGLTTRTYDFLRQAKIPGVNVDPRVVARPSGSTEFSFQGDLDASELRVQLDDQEQHGTVLAKLDRKHGAEARVIVIGIYR